MTWLAKLPTRARFIVGLVLLVLVPISVIGISYVGMTEIHRSQTVLYDENFSNVYDLASLRANINAERLDVAVMLETPQAEWDQWRKDLDVRARYDDVLLQRLLARPGKDASEQDQIRQLIDLRNSLRRTQDEQTLPLMGQGNIEEAKRLFVGAQLDIHARMRTLIHGIEGRELTRAQNLVNDTDRNARGYVLSFVILGGGMVLVALTIAGAMQWMAAAYISERKRAEETLRERRREAEERSEQFRLAETFFNHSITGLVILDRDYNFIRVNPAYARACRREIGDFAGKNHFDMYPSDAKQIFDEVVRTKHTFSTFAREFVFPDQPERGLTYWDWTLVPVLDQAGEVEYLVFSLKEVTERKRAEEALQRANTYNRSLIEASLDPLVTIGEDGKITDVNVATEGVTGQSRDKLIGEDFSNYFTEPQKARAGYEEVFHTGYVRDYPLEIRHRDGHTTPVLYNASLYRDSAGKVQGVFAAARDISQRKRAEEALSRANAYNRSLIEASLDPLVTIGPDGKITDVNAATETITGRSREELIGDDFSNYFTESDKAQAGYEEVFRVGYVRDYPLDIRHRDGHTTPVLYNASVYRDPAGKVLGAFAAARDITERKRAEEAISASEERFRLIAETIEDVFWISTPGVANMVYISPAYERVWGRSRESLYRAPHSFTDIIHSEDKATVESAMDRHREGKPYQIQYRIVREDGIRWMSERGFPVLDSEGRLRYMTGVVSDITTQKQLEEELRAHRDHLEGLVKARTSALETANARLQELDRLKSMFIASMSHELRTPLNTIIGFTGIMLQGMAGDINDEQRKQLTMVKESAAHLLALINDVIDVSKIEAGMVELSVGTFDLSDLANEVARSFGLAVSAKGIALGVETPYHVVVEGDRRRIKQILVNLVGNAVKFTDSGRIDIRVSGDERAVEVAVRDTGIGISAGNLPKLFNAFSQIVVEGRPREGSGLGLYLSRKIAHLMKGDISVQSEVGKGSVFTLALPLTVKRASFKGAA